MRLNAVLLALLLSLMGATQALAQYTINTLLSFSNSYTLAPGDGGTLTMDNGSSPAAINDENGSHTISAPLILNSNTDIDIVNAGDKLTVSGGISGSAALSLSGSGTLVISTASNTVTGLTINPGATIDRTTAR
jgi:hypothetical protein